MSQRGGQQQPSVGDRMVVVEGNGEPLWALGGWHRGSALLVGTDGRLSNAILPAQRAFLIIGSRLHLATQRWIQAECSRFLLIYVIEAVASPRLEVPKHHILERPAGTESRALGDIEVFKDCLGVLRRHGQEASAKRSQIRAIALSGCSWSRRR